MARGIGPTRNSNAVRNALRHCQRHPCVCLAEAINRLVDGHDTGQGWNKGILERIAAMLSPTADPPGTIRNGRDTWETHTEQLQGRKRGLENLVEEYNAQGCGGGGHAVVIDPAAVAAARRASIPTAEDYWDRYPDRRPTSRTTPPPAPPHGNASGMPWGAHC